MLKKCIIAAVCAVLVYYIAGMIYNAVFPSRYLEKNFPELEIISRESSKGSWSFWGSDIGYTYLHYDLYDPDEEMNVRLGFEYRWFFPFYKPLKGYEEIYTGRVKHIHAERAFAERCREAASEYCECFAVINPRSHEHDLCCHIFLCVPSADALENVIRAVENIQKTEYEYVWTHYSIFACMDSGIYRELENTDFSGVVTKYTGFAYFSDLLEGFETERITSSNSGYSRERFLAGADPSDSEYKDPDSFSHLVFWISGEHFYLFGVN